MEVRDITTTLKEIIVEKEGAGITQFDVTNHHEFYKESEVIEVNIRDKTEVPFNPVTERCETLSTNRTNDPMSLTYTAENTNDVFYAITDETTTHVGFNGHITAKAMATLSAGIGVLTNLTSRKSMQLRHSSSRKTTNVIRYTVRPGYRGVLKRNRYTRKVIVPCRLNVKVPKAFKFECKYRTPRKPRPSIIKYPEIKATAVFGQLSDKHWQNVTMRKSFWSKKYLECQLKAKIEYISETREYFVKTEKII